MQTCPTFRYPSVNNYLNGYSIPRNGLSLNTTCTKKYQVSSHVVFPYARCSLLPVLSPNVIANKTANTIAN